MSWMIGYFSLDVQYRSVFGHSAALVESLMIVTEDGEMYVSVAAMGRYNHTDGFCDSFRELPISFAAVSSLSIVSTWLSGRTELI